MEYEWDPAKSRRNAQKHGCGFEIAAELDWSEALEVLDDRFDYGEERWLALGPIDGKLYAMIFSPRGENRARIISLRPATRNERNAYVEAKR